MNSQIFNVTCITSRSNSTIVKIAKLSQKKSRRDERLFTLDGVKLFLEACNFGARIEYVILNENTTLDVEIINKIKTLQNKNIQVICVNESVFSKLTEESAPQGVITVCRFLNIHNYVEKISDFGTERVMIFEAVRDPGNIGSILRNAAAFGIDRLVFSADCADIYSQKVIRASMGAIFKVKIDIAENLTSTVEVLKKSGRRVIATTLKENSLRLSEDTIYSSDVFIVGNEGHGVSEETVKASDETMFIPMCQSTESLNASVAGAILMWELFKIQ